MIFNMLQLQSNLLCLAFMLIYYLKKYAVLLVSVNDNLFKPKNQHEK
jgi:hypothetical protein